MTKRDTNTISQSNILTLLPSTAESAYLAEVAMRQRQNAKAFLRLEEPVNEVAHMAQVVEDLVLKADEDGAGMSTHLQWAILHLADMAKDLQSHFRFKADNDKADSDDEEGSAA